MRKLKSSGAAILAVGLLGASAGAVMAQAGEPADALEVVVIGDSIPFAAFCPGCTGFVDLYARDLESRTGRPVEVINLSRDDSAGLREIRDQVAADLGLRDAVTGADIVLVSVGYNNALPDPYTGVGCSGGFDSAKAYAEWMLATTPECRKEGLDVWAADYDTIFSEISSLRGDDPTVLAALNVHNGNKGNWDIHNSGLEQAMVDDWEEWVTLVYDDWNAMLCDRAAAAGFTCVDVYHAFNGPTGEETSEAWTVDGAHPSQEGSQLIADLLAGLDVSAIANGPA